MPQLKGTQHPKHKLTPEAVREIRTLYRPGCITYREIAEQYGVSLQLIARVIDRTAWGWVTDTTEAAAA